MSILSPSPRTRTPIPRHAVAVHGTALGATLRSVLYQLGYNPAARAAAVDWIGTHGTAAGSGFIEAADVEPLDEVVARFTGDVEADPSEWPDWCDSGFWTPSAFDPIEPEDVDRIDWARESARFDEEDVEWLSATAAAYDALAAGLTPADHKPVRVRPGDVGTPAYDRQVAVAARLDAMLGSRSRPQPSIEDSDVLHATGCVG